MHTDTTGIPQLPRESRGSMLSSLQSGPYRFFLGSQFLSTVGVWSLRVAVDWALMSATGDITLVGSLVILQFGPVLLFGMWGGVLVDRYSLKKLLLISQTLSFAVSAFLLVVAATGHLAPWMMFVTAGVLGLGAVVDQPARQVLVGQTVSPLVLANAISMNSIAFQIGAMIGPAVSGILLANAGEAVAFAFPTALHFSALVALTVVFARTPLAPRGRTARTSGLIRDALRYAAAKPEIRMTLLSLVLVCTMGLNWPVVLVSMTTTEFDSGADGYGLANAALAVGSFVGALISLRRTHRGLRTVVIAVCGTCFMRAISGLMPTQASFLVTIAVTGVWLILMWTAANSLLQWSSNSTIRGRIMSLYLMIAVGGQALGGPLLGWSCSTIGPRLTLVISGLIPMCAALALTATTRRSASA
ncbi:MAG: MFS transporter [Microbacterium sp.]